MTNFSTKFPFLLNSSNMYYSMNPENGSYSNGYLQESNNGIPINSSSDSYPEIHQSSIEICISVFTVVICFLGLTGNGIVIWLLTFSIPRNPFNTFLLNLAVADFGVLLFIPLLIILHLSQFNIFFPFYMEELFLCMFTPAQLLLIAISFDRCVSVHFPIWHRCHRPGRFSSIVCAAIWVLSFFLCGIPCTLLLIDPHEYHFAMFYVSFSVPLLCLPLMAISTLILFIKVCFKPTQHKRGNILSAILLTLLFFIIFALPFNIIFYFSFDLSHSLPIYGFIFASLNSSINPLIYFLVGRRKRGQCRESVKVVFHRIFSDEKDCRPQLDFTVETQL